ncbi:MAG: hypothetical protein A3K09_08270 [Nitrospinae bacterium RIFCSPLOWO2_12_FULL_47_7]|nr:MAG: hypothetical protein A3K09_08270 [Nitrospinae bacterium RIFCSPLOWO2_12_FULL_47_7]
MSNRLKTVKTHYIVFPSPLGLIGVAATPAGLCCIKIKISGEPAFRNYLQKKYRQIPENNKALLKNIESQINLYFTGKLRRLSCPLDLSQGTPFQKKVWRKLISIPFGATHNYEWLAIAIGNAKACRAVGNAIGQNPLPIIIPCHRIVRKCGELGGYSGGVHIKRFLLDLEKKSHGTV